MRRRWFIAAAMGGTLAIAAPALAGDGTFTAAPDSPIVVGSTPAAIAVGDFNQDGDRDLALANRDGGDVTLLLGAAGSSFTAAPAVAVGDAPSSIATGDFNADGDDDLAVANPGSNTVSILTGGAGAGFTAATIAVLQGPSSIATGDFNADGDVDLAVATFNNNRVAVLLGGAGSSFAPAPGSPFPAGDSPSAIAAADFNGDGDPDLAVTSVVLSKITVLVGGAGGGFTTAVDQPPTGDLPLEIVAGDFDDDGEPDLATANSSSDDVSILRGSTGVTFATGVTVPVGDGPSAITTGDFNGDSDDDLVVADQQSAGASVLLGGAAASFAAAPGSPLAVGDQPLAVAVADFDGDGNQDLATADGGADTVSLYTGNSVVTPPPPPPAGDSDPPETRIDKAPKRKSMRRKVRIEFSADEPATFECRLDGEAFAACAAPFTERVSRSRHKFFVRAVDAAGNVDPTPAEAKFKVRRKG